MTTPTAIVYRQAVQLTVHSTLTTSIRVNPNTFFHPAAAAWFDRSFTAPTATQDVAELLTGLAHPSACRSAAETTGIGHQPPEEQGLVVVQQGRERDILAGSLGFRLI